jgi:drug/metabolite transporter (DMT)-like permease
VMETSARRLLGGLAIFASAFCFYLSTVVIRFSKEVVLIDPSFFAFVRFVIGFVVVCIIMTFLRQPPRPRNYHLLVGRTLANCVAVYCFYMAVKQTTVAEANILNMTYPVFVAIFTWIWLRSQHDPLALGMVGVAFIGIWLILSPGHIDIKLDNLWGLASGLFASFAIIYLNISRQIHDTNTVLFFMFGLGAITMFLFFHGRFFLPDATALYYLVMCGIWGVTGQFLITVGFRFITAVEGGIISSMRIFIAAMLGPFVVGETPLNMAGWIGASLLFAANAILAVRHRN